MLNKLTNDYKVNLHIKDHLLFLWFYRLCDCLKLLGFDHSGEWTVAILV